jgi:hypothetical protein
VRTGLGKELAEGTVVATAVTLGRAIRDRRLEAVVGFVQVLKAVSCQ